MASAMCPTCKILLVEGNTNSFANLATVTQFAANQPGVVAVSNSYGAPEGSYMATYAAAYSHPGVAITASTGDSGCGVDFPAVLPNVLAVGGTNLKRAGNARGWAETAWAGAGSGCSNFIARQSFQDDTLCTRRSEADVSAVADPNTVTQSGNGNVGQVYQGGSKNTSTLTQSGNNNNAYDLQLASLNSSTLTQSGNGIVTVLQNAPSSGG